MSIRKTLHLVFDQCVASIGNPIQIRAANAMLTLGILLQEVFAKQGYKNFSHDVVELVIGCVLPLVSLARQAGRQESSLPASELPTARLVGSGTAAQT